MEGSCQWSDRNAIRARNQSIAEGIIAGRGLPYCAVGDRKSKSAAQETWTYGVDHDNHLIWVEKRAADGGTLQKRVDYKYDALGNRIERTEDSDGNSTLDVTERFVYDGEHVYADLNGSNVLQFRRLFGDSVDSPIVRVSNAGVVVWYLTDYQVRS